MEGSYRLFRQMAQVSVQMAHDHIATAFHCEPGAQSRVGVTRRCARHSGQMDRRRKRLTCGQAPRQASPS